MQRLLAALAAMIVAFAPARLAAGEQQIMTAAGFPATMTDPSATAPIVLFIAGSGPTDRDGNSVLGVRASYLAKLAEELARHGVASLRYDKRGVQGSVPVANEAEVTFGTFVDDAVEVFDWLRSTANGRSVLLLGHSEGGLVAMEVARRRSDVEGLVLTTTPGLPPAETLRNQLQALPEPLLSQARDILAEIEAGKQAGDVPDPLLPLFRPTIQPFLQTLLALRPAEALAALTIPVLVIGGGSDLQVGRADFDTLTAARPDVRSRWFEQMNHILVDAPTDRAANLATYADPEIPLTQGLGDTIAGFAKGR